MKIDAEIMAEAITFAASAAHLRRRGMGAVAGLDGQGGTLRRAGRAGAPSQRKLQVKVVHICGRVGCRTVFR